MSVLEYRVSLAHGKREVSTNDSREGVRLVDSVCDACPENDAVFVVGPVGRFDGDMKLARLEGFVDSCLAGVVTEDDTGMESRATLS